MCFLRGSALFAILAASSFAADQVLNFNEVFGNVLPFFASAVDKEGNIYLAGVTQAPTVLTTPNAFQGTFQQTVCSSIVVHPGGPPLQTLCRHGFIVKIDPSGTKLLYGTYLAGDGDDYITGIAVDNSGNAYITGTTSSSNFPVTPGAYMNSGSGFLLKLNAQGTGLVFSTHLPDQPHAAALDRAGHIYVVGYANGSDFPTTPGAFQSKRNLGQGDVYVMKFTPDASKVEYSTLLGGTFDDQPSAIAIDGAGYAYVAGYTASTPYYLDYYTQSGGTDYVLFPTTQGSYQHPGARADAFISKINPEGTGLAYSTVFGGAGNDRINGIVVDQSGAVYFGGSSESIDFPVTANAFQKTYGGGFIGKISADGSRLLFSTFLGTGYPDSASPVAVDAAGDVFVSGTAYRAPFPTTPTADQFCYPTLPGYGFSATPIYAELNSQGTKLLYGTFATNIVAVDSTGAFYSPGDTRILRRIDPSAAVPPAVRCVANAASLRQGPIAPGEIVSIFGPGIGPDEAMSATPVNGKMPKTLLNTTVAINGIPAPLLYVSTNQINAVVPFGIAGATAADVKIERPPVDIGSATVAVAPAAPGAFTLDGSGYGQAAAINQDGTVNGPAHAAPQGSIVSLYLTGFGQMQPVPEDGAIAPGPISRCSVKFEAGISLNPFPLEVLYCGDAPGFVAGAIQLNVRIPEVFTNGQTTFSVQIGDISLPNSVSLAVSLK